MATRRTRRALIAALALQGFDNASIAKQANISLRTVARYLADAETRAQIRDAERERLRHVARRAGALGASAITILAQIANDRDEPSGARVAAASRLVDVMLRLHEAVDLAERVAALEAQLRELPDTRSRYEGGPIPWPRTTN